MTDDNDLKEAVIAAIEELEERRRAKYATAPVHLSAYDVRLALRKELEHFTTILGVIGAFVFLCYLIGLKNQTVLGELTTMVKALGTQT